MISGFKDTTFSTNKTINVRNNLLCFDSPLIMGIVNLTDDSFFDGGKYNTLDKAIERVESVLEEGADIVDFGACSTRPGATLVDKKEEARRLLPVITETKKRHPGTIVSVDTVWSEVAQKAFDCGADILNDISGGQWDEKLFETAAKNKMPYILTHTSSTPDKMQKETSYNNLFMDICLYFSQRLELIYQAGVKDVILDPGYGFGKTLEQNYELLRRQDEFEVLGLPILAGLSRKSMIYRPLGLKSTDVLAQTTFLHALALEKGANILRVHDVKTAKECLRLYNLYRTSGK